MQDYTLMIQAKIKQEEAQKEKNRRFLIREIENARRLERTNRDSAARQNTAHADQDTHN